MQRADDRWRGILLRAAVFGALATAIVGPWIGGRLLLLDWVTGDEANLHRTFFGLDGGLLPGPLFSLAAHGLDLVVGAQSGWILVWLAIFIAGIAAGELIGGPLSARVCGGLLYTVNPLVFDRVWVGHFAYLLGYALLPLAVRSMISGPDADRRRLPRAGLWIAALGALSPHFIWICGVVVFAVVLQRRARAAALRWGLVTAIVAGGLSMVTVVPTLGSGYAGVTHADLVAYRTVGHPQLGLFANLAGLAGFWRREPPLPSEEFAGWPILVLAVLVIVVAGLRSSWRDGERRPAAVVLVTAGFGGYVLALGDQGPFAVAFRMLFDNVPGFAVMREPQKFVALLALVYAVGFGRGVLVLTEKARTGRSLAMTYVAAAVLALSLAPTLLFGMAGRLRPTEYPPAWGEAQDVMGSGTGWVLFLPWHQYLSFPFVGRIIANPAEVAFSRPVISGDNVELPNLRTSSTSPRSRYLQALFDAGPRLCSFGDLVAPVGVEFVVLAKTVDWTNYDWLNRQVDLSPVADSPDLIVYRNLRFRPGGIGGVAKLPRSPDELVGLSATEGIAGRAVPPIDVTGLGAATSPDCRAPALSRTATIRRTAPTRYLVNSPEAGIVALPEPFDRGWSVKGGEPVELLGGMTGVEVPAGVSALSFRRWPLVRNTYLAGVAAFVLLLATTCRAPKRSTLGEEERREVA